MSEHALYSPSSCYRNLTCKGSIALIKKTGAVSKKSAYSEEGTEAHDWISKALETIHGGSTFNFAEIPNEEMRDHVQNYCSFIGQLNQQFRRTHKGVQHFIEHRMKYDGDFWGTGDYVLTGFRKDNGLSSCLICDFKYGKGVTVEAEDNEQLLCYLLCLQKDRNIAFDTAHFFIFQPRTTKDSPFTRWSVDRDTIGKCEVQIVNNKKQCLKILSDFEDGKDIPADSIVPGSHCRFCPAKQDNKCPKYLEDLNSTKLKLLDTLPEVLPDVQVLTIDQKVEIFKRRKMLNSFIDDICKEVLLVAMENGIEGHKIVKGQQRRMWAKQDVEKAEKKLIALGVDKPTKKTLIAISEVEKQIGKDKIDDLTTLTKPSYQLVLVDDERPAITQVGLEELGEIEL